MRSVLSPLMVLVRPRATFARLAEKPRMVWLFAMMVLLATLLVRVSVGMPHMLEAQDEMLNEANVGVSVSAEEAGPGARDEAGVRTPEDAKHEAEANSDEDIVIPEGAEDTIRTMTVIGGYVFGSLGVVLGTLLLAGVIYGVSRMWSKETAFAVVLGMVALAKMPDAVRDVTQAVYMAGTGKWLEHQGLGALVAPKGLEQVPSAGYVLLSMVDIYALWFVVLLFVGMRVAMGLERRRALVLTGSFVAIGALLAVGPTVLLGSFLPT